MRTVVLSFFLFMTSFIYGGVVSDGLKKITLNDASFIKKFVEINLKWHQLAHVIYFDNKPMCLCTASIRSPDKQPMDVYWLKGWQAFKKNEHLFPHPNFIFNSSIDESEPGWKSMTLFIINKRALAKCINQYLLTFQEILGEECSLDWLITEFEGSKSVYDILKNDERLLGILLGYGKESATAYYEAISSYKGIAPSHTTSYCPVEAKKKSKCTFFPIVIMGNPNSSEVQSLISTYEKELEIFWHVYRRQKSLELFLRCICDEKDDLNFFTAY